MPNKQNLQFSKLEGEKKVLERIKEQEKDKEKFNINAEKEVKPEIIQADKDKELLKITSTEGEIGVKVGGIATINNNQKEREKQIEKILEKNLEAIYTDMSPNKQQEFKAVGEQTAHEINNLLNQAKIKIKKIIDLIKKWLLLIPGVNKFFLEQEAKIKADEIIKLENRRQKTDDR